MLNDDDAASLRGITIDDATVAERDGRQVLRLRLTGGEILAITGDGLNVVDETSMGSA